MPLFQRALAIDEKALGPEHLSVATGFNNLAGLYAARGGRAALAAADRAVIVAVVG